MRSGPGSRRSRSAVPAAAGEEEARWLERARAAAARGPLGHHPHWTSPTHARPTRPADAEASGGSKGNEAAALRVRDEGLRLRELGLAPTLFCGGGWYTDAGVAEACAGLGYADCTPRASRPPYLARGEPWAFLPAPAAVRLPSGARLLAIPTTHSLGDLARAVLRRRALPGVVHLYFHDMDLADRRRRALLGALLPVLARLAEPADPDGLRAELEGEVPEIDWADVARF